MTLEYACDTVDTQSLPRYTDGRSIQRNARGLILNMRILHAVINKRSEDIIKNMMIDDLNGVVCFIPSIVVGESMAIMSSNAVWVRYRTTPIVSISIDANTGVYSVHTEDVSYEILDLEKDQKRRKKRIVSTLYMESRILHNPLREEKDPDGHLFADGRYRTKIFASDLPEFFVYGYLYKRHGFISAASVKHLLYVSNYIFNHRHKYDSLYISYDEPIRPVAVDHGVTLYDGCKHAVGGPLILDFVNAAAKYSGYDVADILKEIQRKSDWYDEKYGKNGSNGVEEH